MSCVLCAQRRGERFDILYCVKCEWPGFDQKKKKKKSPLSPLRRVTLCCSLILYFSSSFQVPMVTGRFSSSSWNKKKNVDDKKDDGKNRDV